MPEPPAPGVATMRFSAPPPPPVLAVALDVVFCFPAAPPPAPPVP